MAAWKPGLRGLAVLYHLPVQGSQKRIPAAAGRARHLLSRRSRRVGSLQRTQAAAERVQGRAVGERERLFQGHVRVGLDLFQQIEGVLKRLDDHALRRGFRGSLRPGFGVAAARQKPLEGGVELGETRQKVGLEP